MTLLHFCIYCDSHPLFAWGGFRQIDSQLMIARRDNYALLYVISLVEWPKHISKSNKYLGGIVLHS